MFCAVILSERSESKDPDALRLTSALETFCQQTFLVILAQPESPSLSGYLLQEASLIQGQHDIHLTIVSHT